VNRRTFIGQTDQGEILITLYDDGMTGATMAFRPWTGRTWGPPTILRETE
jgi:hypothetical protein